MGVVIALSLVFNIITHYTRSKQIRRNIAILTWMVDLLKYAGKIEKKNFPILKDFPLKETLKKVQSAKIKGIHYMIFESQNVLLEYVKAVFLAELIVYGKYMKLLESKREAFLQLYLIMGKIDSYISIASVRDTYPVWCVPEFYPEGDLRVTQHKAYHPLIRYPVPNDLDMKKCILITGSNASI